MRLGVDLEPTEGTESWKTLANAALAITGTGGADRMSIWRLLQAWGRSIAPNWRFWLTAPRTFPTIDRFLNGVATSVKSFDLAAKTYQNADRLGGAIARFANQLAGFTCGRVGDIRVGDGQISNRGLEIVVQASKLTEAQAKAIADAAQKAPRVGATIEVIGVK